jgi:hypothetical protein
MDGSEAPVSELNIRERYVNSGEKLRDPATTSWRPTLSFDSVAIQIGRLVQLLVPLEDLRAATLRTKLISEQSRISSWARERNISTLPQLSDLLTDLPNATQSTVASVCMELEEWIKLSYEILDPYRPKTGGLSEVEKLKLMVEGYNFLETLRTVNNGLYSIASSVINRQPLLNFGNGAETPRALSRDSFPEVAISAELPGSTILPYKIRHVEEENKFRNPNSIDESPSDYREAPSALKLLFNNCLQALRVVTTQLPNKSVPNRIYSRLVVWGCGLFPNSMTLDHILEGEHDDALSGFRSHVVGTLADIAILLGIY